MAEFDLNVSGPQVQSYDPLAGMFQKNPRIDLRVKIAKERAARQEEKRKIDEATMPYIQKDIAAEQKSQIDIQAKIDEALNALNTPAPTMERGYRDSDILAAGIGSVLAPGSTPEILNALRQMTGARNESELEDRLRQHGLSIKTATMAIDRLSGDLNASRENERYMLEANRRESELQRQIAEKLRQEGRQVEAAILEYRARVIGSKDEFDLSANLTSLDDLIRLNPQFAGLALEPEKVEKVRSGLAATAAQKIMDEDAKLKVQADKDAQTNREQLAKEFTAGVWKQFGARGPGGSQDTWEKALYTRQRLIKEGIDPALLVIPSKKEWMSPDRMYDKNSPQNKRAQAASDRAGSKAKSGGKQPDRLVGELRPFVPGLPEGLNKMPTATDIADLNRQIKELESQLPKGSVSGFFSDVDPQVKDIKDEIERLKKLRASYTALRSAKVSKNPKKSNAAQSLGEKYGF